MDSLDHHKDYYYGEFTFHELSYEHALDNGLHHHWNMPDSLLPELVLFDLESQRSSLVLITDIFHV